MVMNSGPEPTIVKRLESLEAHLKDENPILLSVVQSYRELDRVAYRLGYLPRDASFAAMIPWWPLIAVLGTFSSGKSTFINHYLDYKLQTTGNQAVDDKFSVICHSREKTVHILPGLALDADARFPFYQISEDIEKVASGEGRRVDAYLQLKTCPSDRMLGRILIDSPGFDADAQRTSTLRITQHIIDLSDLVLVFFDARHPEPGAMQDTLSHLVERCIGRSDSSKFLYILNQIDTAAREDNPEEIFGAWQRALAQKGLTAGRFYTIYNPHAAVPIDDDALRRRFETKRDSDLAEIHGRMYQVQVERAYRIVGSLEETARDIEERVVPLLEQALERWKKNTLTLDATVFGALAALLLAGSIQAGYWGAEGLAPWLDGLLASPVASTFALIVAVLGGAYLHFGLRKVAARQVEKWLGSKGQNDRDRAGLLAAFRRNTAPWRSIFHTIPTGWGRKARKHIAAVVGETDQFVQALNDRYANPSGAHAGDQPAAEPVEAQVVDDTRLEQC